MPQTRPGDVFLQSFGGTAQPERKRPGDAFLESFGSEPVSQPEQPPAIQANPDAFRTDYQTSVPLTTTPTFVGSTPVETPHTPEAIADANRAASIGNLPLPVQRLLAEAGQRNPGVGTLEDGPNPGLVGKLLGLLPSRGPLRGIKTGAIQYANDVVEPLANIAAPALAPFGVDTSGPPEGLAGVYQATDPAQTPTERISDVVGRIGVLPAEFASMGGVNPIGTAVSGIGKIVPGLAKLPAELAAITAIQQAAKGANPQEIAGEAAMALPNMAVHAVGAVPQAVQAAMGPGTAMERAAQFAEKGEPALALLALGLKDKAAEAIKSRFGGKANGQQANPVDGRPVDAGERGPNVRPEEVAQGGPKKTEGPQQGMGGQVGGVVQSPLDSLIPANSGIQVAPDLGMMLRGPETVEPKPAVLPPFYRRPLNAIPAQETRPPIPQAEAKPVPEAAQIPDISTRRTQYGFKRPWEMTGEELRVFEQRAREHDKTIPEQVFGPELGATYRKLERAANTSDNSREAQARATDASRKMSEMEDGLSAEQQDLLFGRSGPPYETAQTYRDFAREAEYADEQNIAELVRGGANAIRTIGPDPEILKNPEKADYRQQLAMARMAAINRAIERFKIAPQQVSDGIKRAAINSVDPADVDFMFEKWFAREAPPKDTIRPVPQKLQADQKQLPPPLRQLIRPEAKPPTQEAQATGVARPRQAIQFESVGEGRKRWAVISPSAKNKGKWQTTFFDDRGFSSDTTHTTQKDAIKELMRYEGFRSIKDDVLSQKMKDPQFQEGNNLTRLIGFSNVAGQQHWTELHDAYKAGGIDAAAKVFGEIQSRKSPRTDTPDPATPAIPPADAATGPVVSKQPWEMTRDEFNKEAMTHLGPSGISEMTQGWFGPSDQVETWKKVIQSRTGKTPQELSQYVAMDQSLPEGYRRADRANDVPERGNPINTDAFAIGTSRLKKNAHYQEFPFDADPHRQMVAQALREGKPVPAEVLKDYPDLSPPSGQAAPPISPGESAPPAVFSPDVPKWGIYKVNVRGRGESFAVRESDNPRGFGDSIHDTLEAAQKYAKESANMEAVNAESRRKAAEANAAQAAKEQAARAIRDDIDGFAADKTPMQRGAVIKALNSLIRIDGKADTLKNHVREMVKSGKVELTTSEESKIKPMSRTAYNRATNQEQAAHEKRMAAAGTKTVYRVNGYDLGKTAYDYAAHLQSKPENATPNPERTVIPNGKEEEGQGRQGLLTSPSEAQPPQVDGESPAVEPRQPWQMTRGEAVDSAASKVKELKKEWTALKKQRVKITPGDPSYAMLSRTRRGEDIGFRSKIAEAEKFAATTAATYHKMDVATALREGKPVPADVLKDYPDLKPPASGGESAPVEPQHSWTPDDIETYVPNWLKKRPDLLTKWISGSMSDADVVSEMLKKYKKPTDSRLNLSSKNFTEYGDGQREVLVPEVSGRASASTRTHNEAFDEIAESAITELETARLRGKELDQPPYIDELPAKPAWIDPDVAEYVAILERQVAKETAPHRKATIATSIMSGPVSPQVKEAIGKRLRELDGVAANRAAESGPIGLRKYFEREPDSSRTSPPFLKAKADLEKIQTVKEARRAAAAKPKKKPASSRAMPPPVFENPPTGIIEKFAKKKPLDQTVNALGGDIAKLRERGGKADIEAKPDVMVKADVEMLNKDTSQTRSVRKKRTEELERAAAATKKLKEFIRTVPEFKIDPVFVVTKTKQLSFQDGGRYVFNPEAIGFDPAEIKSHKEGTRIGFDYGKVEDAKAGDVVQFKTNPGSEQVEPDAPAPYTGKISWMHGKKPLPSEPTEPPSSGTTLTAGPNIETGLKLAREATRNITDLWSRKTHGLMVPLPRELAAITGRGEGARRVGELMRNRSDFAAELHGQNLPQVDEIMRPLSKAQREQAMLVFGQRETSTDHAVNAAAEALRRHDEATSAIAEASGLLNADGEQWKPNQSNWINQQWNPDAIRDMRRERGHYWDQALKVVGESLDDPSKAADWLRAYRLKLVDTKDPLAQNKRDYATPTVSGAQLKRRIIWPREFLQKDLVESYIEHKRGLLTKAAEASVIGAGGENLKAAAGQALNEAMEFARKKGNDIPRAKHYAEQIMSEWFGRELGTRQKVSGEDAVRKAMGISAILHLSVGTPFPLVNVAYGMASNIYRHGLLRTLKHSAKDVPAFLKRGEGYKNTIESGALDWAGVSATFADMHIPSMAKEILTGFAGATEAFNRTVAAQAGKDAALASVRGLHKVYNRSRGSAAEIIKSRQYRDLLDRGFTQSELLKIAAKGELTPEQVRQAQRGSVEVSQYLARPQDLPRGMTAPVGRMFYQFWPMAYKQAQHSVVHALREAGHGNLVPVARFIPIAIAAGMTTQAVRNLFYGQQHTPEDETKIAKFLGYLTDATGVMDRGMDVITSGNKTVDALQRNLTPVFLKDAKNLLQGVTSAIYGGKDKNARIKGVRRALQTSSAYKAVEQQFTKFKGSPAPLWWNRKAPYTPANLEKRNREIAARKAKEARKQ